GLKSFFMSHSSIRCGCVSARQIFSGGKGSSRSTTTESVSVVVLLIGPSYSFTPTRHPRLPLYVLPSPPHQGERRRDRRRRRTSSLRASSASAGQSHVRWG